MASIDFGTVTIQVCLMKVVKVMPNFVIALDECHCR